VRFASVASGGTGIHRFVHTFRLLAREAGRSQRVVELHGELGLADVDRLEEALREMAVEARTIVVGLESCELIDSIALAALLRARDRLADDGCRLAIAAPTGQVRRILEISGCDQEGFLFDTVDQALSGG
jgi:anti-sigma B factor antagonist